MKFPSRKSRGRFISAADGAAHLGNWKRTGETVAWQFELDKPGRYAVELECAVRLGQCRQRGPHRTGPGLGRSDRCRHGGSEDVQTAQGRRWSTLPPRAGTNCGSCRFRFLTILSWFCGEFAWFRSGLPLDQARRFGNHSPLLCRSLVGLIHTFQNFARSIARARRPFRALPRTRVPPRLSLQIMELPDYVQSVSFRLAHPDVPGSKAFRLATGLLRRMGVPLTRSTRVCPARTAPCGGGCARHAARVRPAISPSEPSSTGPFPDWPPGEAFVALGVSDGFPLLAAISGNPDKPCIGVDLSQGTRNPFVRTGRSFCGASSRSARPTTACTGFLSATTSRNCTSCRSAAA